MTPLLTTGKNSSGELDLSGVEVGADRVVGDAEALNWLAIHKTLGYSAFQLGVLERALELTAEYARTREQFDRPIGSFRISIVIKPQHWSPVRIAGDPIPPQMAAFPPQVTGLRPYQVRAVRHGHRHGHGEHADSPAGRAAQQ